jgi:hypothetical protein
MLPQTDTRTSRVPGSRLLTISSLTISSLTISSLTSLCLSRLPDALSSTDTHHSLCPWIRRGGCVLSLILPLIFHACVSVIYGRIDSKNSCCRRAESRLAAVPRVYELSLLAASPRVYELSLDSRHTCHSSSAADPQLSVFVLLYQYASAFVPVSKCFCTSNARSEQLWCRAPTPPSEGAGISVGTRSCTRECILSQRRSRRSSRRTPRIRLRMRALGVLVLAHKPVGFELRQILRDEAVRLVERSSVFVRLYE